VLQEGYLIQPVAGVDVFVGGWHGSGHLFQTARRINESHIPQHDISIVRYFCYWAFAAHVIPISPDARPDYSVYGGHGLGHLLILFFSHFSILFHNPSNFKYAHFPQPHISTITYSTPQLKYFALYSAIQHRAALSLLARIDMLLLFLI